MMPKPEFYTIGFQRHRTVEYLAVALHAAKVPGDKVQFAHDAGYTWVRFPKTQVTWAVLMGFLARPPRIGYSFSEPKGPVQWQSKLTRPPKRIRYSKEE